MPDKIPLADILKELIKHPDEILSVDLLSELEEGYTLLAKVIKVVAECIETDAERIKIVEKLELTSDLLAATQSPTKSNWPHLLAALKQLKGTVLIAFFKQCPVFTNELLSIPGDDNITSLHIALSVLKGPALKAFLENCEELSSDSLALQTKTGATALHIAIDFLSSEDLKLFLARCLPLSQKALMTEFGDKGSVLHLAAVRLSKEDFAVFKAKCALPLVFRGVLASTAVEPQLCPST
ncbi:MAG: hypothetical protein Q7V63_06860 [Gammaproteobacteria bacterium]|nr:hypothetical protein [Gammaproteobacteria bacterium]